MRKKILGIMSLAIVPSMMMVSLTGCGTRAKATDQEVTIEEEMIIATDEVSSEEDIVDTEDEITETEEVIASDEVKEGIDTEASVTEHEYFFALDEDSSIVEKMDMNMLEPNGNNFELKESVTLYTPSQAKVIGYTKPNINVYVLTSSDEWYCIQFENEEPKYQLLIAKADDFIASAGIDDDTFALTYDDVKSAFEEELNSLDGDFKVLDEITDDMESVEIKVPIEGYDVNTVIGQIIVENRFSYYKTFVLEPIYGEPDSIVYLTIRVYYK